MGCKQKINKKREIEKNKSNEKKKIIGRGIDEKETE